MDADSLLYARYGRLLRKDLLLNHHQLSPDLLICYENLFDG